MPQKDISEIRISKGEVGKKTVPVKVGDKIRLKKKSYYDPKERERHLRALGKPPYTIIRITESDGYGIIYLKSAQNGNHPISPEFCKSVPMVKR